MSGLAGKLSARGWDAARAARDRSFSPTVRADPAGPVVLLSPHLDDAVIDCWSVLTSDAPVQVVNVFTGAPPPGTLAFWDELCRAGDSAALMGLRLAEDREALALAGRTPLNLGFRPDPYRTARTTPTLRALDAALAAACPRASLVLGPAVLGTVHPDHLVVRALALALARAGVPVQLYADQPYAVQFGWPHWVTGEEPHQHLDPEVSWRSTGVHLAELDRGRAQVATLDADAAARKLDAMRAYRTQFAMLDRGPVGLLSTPAIHRFEVVWPITG